jgi:hypothetical protein
MKRDKNYRYFGEDRINRFAGNILIPIFLNYSKTHRDKNLEKMLLTSSNKIKSSGNKYTKYIQKNLSPSLKSTSKLSFTEEQGLISFYKKYCADAQCYKCILLNEQRFIK